MPINSSCLLFKKLNHNYTKNPYHSLYYNTALVQTCFSTLFSTKLHIHYQVHAYLKFLRSIGRAMFKSYLGTNSNKAFAKSFLIDLQVPY